MSLTQIVVVIATDTHSRNVALAHLGIRKY